MGKTHRFILFHACLVNTVLPHLMFRQLYCPFQDMDVGYQLGEEEAQIFIKNVNT